MVTPSKARDSSLSRSRASAARSSSCAHRSSSTNGMARPRCAKPSNCPGAICLAGAPWPSRESWAFRRQADAALKQAASGRSASSSRMQRLLQLS